MGSKVLLSGDLPKSVQIRQFRRNAWLPEGHDGEFRYDKTAEFLTVQNKRGSDQLITGLTPEVQKALELKLNLPGSTEKMPLGTLSSHNKAYWGKFRIRIPQEGKTLNVADNPMDELEWRVLLVHQEVANSEEDKINTPFARYVLTSDEQAAEQTNKKIRLKSKAYGRFREMTTESMKDFLRIYGTTHNIQTKMGDDTNIAFIEAETGRVVEEHPDRFLDILEDDSFKSKVFIYKCVEKGLIIKQGTKYTLIGGDVLGFTITETINYLANPNNSEVVLTLKNRLETK